MSGSEVAWRGSFAMDPLRGVLLFGALLVCAAAVGRLDDTPRPSLARAAFLAATGASLAPLVVTGSHVLALTIPVSTAGIALASYATTDEPARLSHAARSIAGLALSDALVLVGIGLAVGRGTAFPPRLSTVAAALVLAGAVIRLSLLSVTGPSREAAKAHVTTELLWLGPLRAQGLLLAVFAVGAHRGVAHAAGALAALAIAVAGVAGATRTFGDIRVGTGTGFALLGIGLGGATAMWGATLAIVATFAGVSAWAAGGGWSAGARTTLASLPAGGLIAASTLVVGGALGAGMVEPWFLALAIPAAAGSLAAAGTVWKAPAPVALPTTAFAGAVGLVAGLSLAAVPVRAASWLGEPMARSLGVGRLLSIGGEPGVPAGLAVIVIGVAAIAFLAGPGTVARVTSEENARLPAPRPPAFPGDAVRADTRRWGFAALFLIAVSVGIAVRVYLVASARGFL
jgi:hypothetical protein